ncbi:MAG: hypothetical protein J0L75_12205 [Spirochaetes bacterium]|nr:hypothetical protein [Spirochaetota bacterium]
MKRILPAILFFVLDCATAEAFTLHPIFADKMVLQRDRAIRIYGQGDEGETVTVEFAGQTATAVVASGRWKVTLKAMKAGGPHSLKVRSAKGEVVVKDVLMGDVWLVTGQSNMQTSVKYYLTKEGAIYAKLLADALTYSNASIRLYKQATIVSEDRRALPGLDRGWGSNWREVSPGNVGDFSATAYYFGKEVQEAVKIPIGLVHATVGGTPVEAWVPKEVLATNAAFADVLAGYRLALDAFPKANSNFLAALDDWNAKRKAGASNLPAAPRAPMGPANQRRPNGLFNGMIAPLVDFEVKGAIWYQGEDNARNYSNAVLYRGLFKAMILNWRFEFKNPDMPFLFCQLAGFGKQSPNVEDKTWSYLREAQAAALDLPHTGMANLIDAGLEDDIHPPFKHESGERLAALAKAKVYGLGNVPCGPVFSGVAFNGSKAVLRFDQVGSGLVAKEVQLGLKYKLEAGDLRGFAVASTDEAFVWAKAEIQANQVQVTHPEGKPITAVRYAWANFHLANLYNKEGFPAAPFRTDDWSPERVPLEVRKATVGMVNVALRCPWSSSNANPLTATRGIYGDLTDGVWNSDGGNGCFSTDSGSQFPKEVVIRLGKPSRLKTLVAFGSAVGGTRNVELALSVDGKTFEAVGKKTFDNYSDAIWVLPLDKPREAAFIRITFLDVYEIGFMKQKSGHVFLRELMAFGDGR